MPPERNDWFDKLQEQFMWMGIFTIFVYFLLKLDWAKQVFGPYIVVAGIVNASAGWVCFLIGGKKTISMIRRIAKAIEEVKKGAPEEEESE